MSEWKRAQREALELLSIVDRVSGRIGCAYSLSGATLAWQVYGHDFDALNPCRLSVCLLYEDYRRLVRALAGNCEEYGIMVADYSRFPDFDTLSTWVFKRRDGILPKERKDDEIAYWTSLYIVPIFYVGDTMMEYRKAKKRVQETFWMLNARAPLPKKRWFSNIQGKIGRIKARRYRAKRLRKNPQIGELMGELTQRTSGKYLLYRDESGKVNMLLSDETDVEHTELLSISVNAFTKRAEIVKRNYPKLEKSPERKASDLILRGGRDLRRIQLIQLEMMIEVDRICRKYGIKYNIAFGTLLGAVRHGGFVPWDDDADINMPYEDYERFKQVVEREIDHEKYYFRVQEKEKDCNITYAHLKRNGTVYTKPNRGEFRYHPGVYVDIVPIFNGAPNFFLHKIQTNICWFFRSACWAYMGANGEKKFWKRQYYRLLARIGNKRAYRLCIRFATLFKKRRNKMLFLNGMDRSPYNVAFVRRECYDDPIELEFEGHKFYAPRDYTSVLNYCYGKDHMMYPPLAKRKTKNNALIDLGGCMRRWADMISARKRMKMRNEKQNGT